MRLSTSKLFKLLTVLVMGLAQVCGLQRGFDCDCGGLERLTVLDHCHGPHTSECHDNELAHEHDEDEEDGEDRHDHAPNVEELLSAAASGSYSVPAPLCEIAFLPVTEVTLLRRDVLLIREDLPERRSCYPPWPQELAHEIELRV